jgi:hypothetical protein
MVTVRTDISGKLIASIATVAKIGEVGTIIATITNRSKLQTKNSM